MKLIVRWVLLFAIGLWMASTMQAQRRGSSSPLETLGEDVSQADGLKILNTFRRLGIAGEYRLNFQLRIMPRREKTRVVSGVLLGKQGAPGPISRIDLAVEPSSVTDHGELIPAKVKRLLLQNGLFANAMELDSWDAEAGQPHLVEAEDYFARIAGSDFTVFDLLMPFSFWQDFVYEGRTTMRSRPTHVFVLTPPADDSELRDHVSKVRIYLDEEFNALNRVDIYDAEGELAKTISVVAFKIEDGQGVLSQIDVRNEKTRDKTRFKVQDVAIGIDAPDDIFLPEGLEQAVYATELARLEPIEKPEQ